MCVSLSLAQLILYSVFCSKDVCSSPSRKEQKRAQYRQFKAHMQKEDGRVTAHGWSLNRNQVGGSISAVLKPKVKR